MAFDLNVNHADEITSIFQGFNDLKMIFDSFHVNTLLTWKACYIEDSGFFVTSFGHSRIHSQCSLKNKGQLSFKAFKN